MPEYTQEDLEKARRLNFAHLDRALHAAQLLADERAATIERCAQECDDAAIYFASHAANDEWWGAEQCAVRIRALKDSK
jgi:hypothetical protein